MQRDTVENPLRCSESSAKNLKRRYAKRDSGNPVRCSESSVKNMTSRYAKRDDLENPLRCSESSVKIITSRCAKRDDRCATRDVLDFAVLTPDAYYVWFDFLILILVLFSRPWLLHLMSDL